MRASSTSVSSDPQQYVLYQSAVNALLVYDKAYTHVRDAVKACARKYTRAILYRERFHAFDAFREALVVLMRATTDALECIAQWRKYAKSTTHFSKGRASPIFVWNGQNFVLTVRNWQWVDNTTNELLVLKGWLCSDQLILILRLYRQLSRSLDFLVCYRELIEWYGDEFPLEFNPFMLAKSLVDKAEAMGLQLATSSVGKVYSLRAAVRVIRRALELDLGNKWVDAVNSFRQRASFASRQKVSFQLRLMKLVNQCCLLCFLSLAQLRLHQKNPDDADDGSSASSMPTWWPETQYDDELLARIARTETVGGK